jgi:hypothetical protein
MYLSIPVTRGSAPGGRARRAPPPDTAFNRWLSTRGETVAELAELLKLSKSAIYHMRDGLHCPSIAVATRIRDLSEGAVSADSWQPKPPKPASRRATSKPSRKKPATTRRRKT